MYNNLIFIESFAKAEISCEKLLKGRDYDTSEAEKVINKGQFQRAHLRNKKAINPKKSSNTIQCKLFYLLI